ncbi:hypothetical protein ACHAQH_004606 [Verticillium albo-atrum]
MSFVFDENLTSRLTESRDFYLRAELRLLDMDGKLPQNNGHRKARFSIDMPVYDGKRTAPNGEVIVGVFNSTIFADQLEFHYASNGQVQDGLRKIRYDNYLIVKLYTRENVEIIVHRQILIAGSLYFDTALRGYFHEADTTEISLDDVSFADLVGYLKLAHRYFFLRFAELDMPSGGLWSSKMNRYDQRIFKATRFKIPMMDLCSILRIFVLADRFASISLTFFIRQIFVKLLAATRELWASNKDVSVDYSLEVHQTFIKSHLDAYMFLTQYACADAAGYLRKAIVDSWVKFLGQDQALKHAMERYISGSGNDYEAFNTAWLKSTAPRSFQDFGSYGFISYNEDHFLRNQAYNAACCTHLLMQRRNDVFALLKFNALENRERARFEGKPFPGEITWTSVVRLAAGDNIKTINGSHSMPDVTDPTLPGKMLALTMDNTSQSVTLKTPSFENGTLGNSVAEDFNVSELYKVNMDFSDCDDYEGDYSDQLPMSYDEEWSPYITQAYMSRSLPLNTVSAEASSSNNA